VTIVHVIVISLVDDDTTDSLDFGNAFECACAFFFFFLKRIVKVERVGR